MDETERFRATILAPWRTHNRVLTELIQGLPAALWDTPVPGNPRRTVRTIAAHIHNSRSRWIRTLGEEHGVAHPPLVDPRRVTRRQIVAALKQSGKGIETLLEMGIARGGQVPSSKRYVWRNLALDVGHVLTYFVAHEAHHRGQLLLIARETGHRVPAKVADRIWWWKPRP